MLKKTNSLHRLKMVHPERTVKKSVKKPQAVEYARKRAVDPFIVYPYFDLLEKLIFYLKLQDNPSAIWNLDETSFSKDPAKTKIVGAKGHAATRMISTAGRNNTTVLFGANAAGDKTYMDLRQCSSDVLRCNQ